jgi:hypothetical protein
MRSTARRATQVSGGMPNKEKTANLQKQRQTIKQLAEQSRVSERTMYMARAVARLNPHLAQQVQAGKMTINKAYVLATKKPKLTTFDKLVKAWVVATDEDRIELLKAAGLIK